MRLPPRNGGFADDRVEPGPPVLRNTSGNASGQWRHCRSHGIGTSSGRSVRSQPVETPCEHVERGGALDLGAVVVERGADAVQLGVEALLHRHAALAGGAERRADDGVGDDGEVGELGAELVVEALLLGGVADGDDRELLEAAGEVGRFLEAQVERERSRSRACPCARRGRGGASGAVRGR